MYVEPEDSVIDSSSIFSKNVNWCDRHVIQSQYLLQILKCSDEKCCKKRRSSIFKFLSEKGLPAPVPLKQTPDGLKIPDLKEVESFASLFVSLALNDNDKIEMTSNTMILYDTFRPSVQSKLADRTCVCKIYFSSIASMKYHLKNNVNCKKLAKSFKPKKIIGQRKDEKLALITYDDGEEDLEWVYDIDVDTDEIFTEPSETENEHYPVEKVLIPIWEDC